VLCYTSDDPIMALRIRDAGAASVMPAGSPIGSGRGIANPAAIRIILELVKGNDESRMANDQSTRHASLESCHLPCPVIVDAGVGTPSDVTMAMELGADGVLLNTGIAHAKDPVRMAFAMKVACEAGYHGYRAGRIPRKMYATASSPWEGVVSHIPGE
jgi:thiazole synthase